MGRISVITGINDEQEMLQRISLVRPLKVLLMIIQMRIINSQTQNINLQQTIGKLKGLIIANPL